MKTFITSLILIVGISMSAFATGAETSPSPTQTPQTTNAGWVNDNLQNALAEMVKKSVGVASDAANKGIALAGDTKDFIVKELPDVVKQLLAWKALENGVWAIILYACFGGLIYGTIKTFKHSMKANDGCALGFGIVFAIVAAIFFCAATYDFMDVLQIWIAPKIYLIEYSKEMLKAATTK